MQTMTNYKAKQIGRKLRNGDARIAGKTCDGDSWPDGDHYWIVEDLEEHETLHIEVDRRPSWSRFAL